MGISNVIQESYCVWSWFLPLATGAIGALIGTYGGACFLQRKQEHKVKNVRLIAIKALKIFRDYSIQKKYYSDTADEFNLKLNISEKRAILVALHKLGIPFETLTKDIFDIKNIKLKEIPIDSEEISAMIEQIDSGNCDNLFFIDIESYFTSNLRLNAVRDVGKKYVNEVLAKSYIDKSTPDIINNPIDWFKAFTPGELQILSVLRYRLANAEYFSINGNPNMEKINTLLREIEIGLWDSYLFWDYDSFMNIQAQNKMASAMQKVFSQNPQIDNR